MDTVNNYRIKLMGDASLDEELILKKFLREGASNLNRLAGHYVIVIENERECYIATSRYGVLQYYYTVRGSQIIHDKTVIGVLRKSSLPWSWNYEALADLALLDHVLENDTLHSQISQTPPGSVLHFRDGSLTFCTLAWEDLHQHHVASPDTALDVFNEETNRLAERNAVLSMSGGFDSRVILSALLKHDCEPLLLTMGTNESTDVVISRLIAATLGLPSMVVHLKPEDYLRYGCTISGLTGGAKTARHWHAFLYTQSAGLDTSSAFFLGTNGEFARTFYFDRGLQVLLASAVPQRSLHKFWSRRLRPVFSQNELGGLNEAFFKEFTEEGQFHRIRRVVNLCHNGLLSGLDRFYLEQRVKNFMGIGLKFYSATVSWRAPFLSQAWVSTVWNLRRDWKLGEKWHRFAVAKNYPRLLDFPVAGGADRMSPRVPLSYWLPIRNGKSVVPYVDRKELFRQEMFSDFLLDNRSLVSELMEPDAVVSIISEHRRSGNRLQAVAWLLAVIFLLLKSKEEQTA